MKTSNEAEFLVAGVDFGSDSVRVSVFSTRPGAPRILTVNREYTRWSLGEFCDPTSFRFRQHPLDHIESLEACFAEIAAELGPNSIGALAVDSTGSTPAPVNRQGVPLALLPEFSSDPDCMFWLWKDRTATSEAVIVNSVLSESSPDYTRYQGEYSSEWWWAKILRGVSRSSRLRKHAFSWVEHSDWVANMLVGNRDVREFARNSCAAGHKALYNENLGGMIPAQILGRIDPYLAEVRETFNVPPVPAGTRLGTLCTEWAERLHLSSETVVGVGSLDAHAGGVGAGIDDGSLVKVMGTSTVDLFLVSYENIRNSDTRRVCGLAENSIIPGRLGGEAGQAAFGDLFAWYKRVLMWPLRSLSLPQLRSTVTDTQFEQLASQVDDSLLAALESAAIQRGPSDIVALDWVNGRRYPNPDEVARGALLYLSIGNDAVDLYRALVESAILGSKAIFERLKASGICFERVILVGGIARKSSFVCQAMASALDVEVMVCQDLEVCAKGAAMYAAVAAGRFATLGAAQSWFGNEFALDYSPDPQEVARYDAAYDRYVSAGIAHSDLGN